MTSVFSWQNSISLCPASFCTSRPNLPVTQWQPTPVLLPGKSQGWRNLVDYLLWGRTESDTTEGLSSSSSRKGNTGEDLVEETGFRNAK